MEVFLGQGYGEGGEIQSYTILEIEKKQGFMCMEGVGERKREGGISDILLSRPQKNFNHFPFVTNSNYISERKLRAKTNQK